MKRADLKEAQYIAPIVNLPSILRHGILSNASSTKIYHETCASQGVQERRDKVVLPNGKRLHDYANVYFNARNPMMYLRKEAHYDLCILAINPKIIDMPGVVISDQNASRRYVLFKPAPDGLSMIDKDLVYAASWKHPDQFQEYKHKGIMCAEILVPDKIDPCYITCAYVSTAQSKVNLEKVLESSSTLQIEINGYLFFQ